MVGEVWGTRMKRCPSCAQPLEESEAVCRHCARPAGDAADPGPVGPPTSSQQESPQRQGGGAQSASPAASQSRSQDPLLILLAIVGLIAGFGAMMLVARVATLRRGEADQAVAAGSAPISAPAGPAESLATVNPPQDLASVPPAGTDSSDLPGSFAPPEPEPDDPPKWTAERVPGSATLTFELSADRHVVGWRRQVRPVLGVRCFSGMTDVYVVTGSPLSVEPEADGHAVRIGFDSEADDDERWLPSTDYQALFAPDGIALARRLAGARTMRFGFTPYNAAPVVAEFDVRGFDALVESIASACKWKRSIRAPSHQRLP